MGFLHLTGRFPTQQPLEILDDLLAFVAHELATDPAAMQDYAQRQATVSAHQEEIRFYLGFRPFDTAARAALSRFLIEEATRLEHMPALLARAEEFLRDRRILLPALSTLRRLAGEQREQARHQVYARLIACVPPALSPRLDALLQVGAEASFSPLQVLKAPPGMPSPPALSRLTAKLDQIQATGVLTLDLSWLNPNLQKALARQAWQASAHRLRLLHAPQRYTILVCFLRHTYHETIDHLVDMYQKLVTATYRRAEQDLEAAVTRSRVTLRGTLQSFHLMGQTLCDDTVPPEAIRATVFAHIPPARLQTQLQEAERWLTGDTSDVFPLVLKRYSYLRQFTPTLLDHLTVDLEPTGSPALLEALAILRDLNATGRRALPDLPIACIPRRLRPFVGIHGTRNRRACECAVLTALRDEIKRGNVWVQGSRRFGKLEDFFLPDAEWAVHRQDFFHHAGLPADPAAAAADLTDRLNTAYERFLATLPDNASVTVDDQGWHLSTDPAETLSPDDERGVATLRAWLREKMPTIRLPELLLAIDQTLDWTRHFLPVGRRATRTADEVCQVVATIMAYGCNLGPETMARLTNGVSYEDIQRITDWYLHEEALRAALADLVNAILALDTTQVWGEGRTSSSDGQRFLFPRRVLRHTYSHRLGDFAVEFYTFIADNYAPYYSVPIECTERDAPYVLDGLLYHESDLDPEEHYTDTHG
jgi:hypothetical protein